MVLNMHVRPIVPMHYYLLSFTNRLGSFIMGVCFKDQRLSYANHISKLVVNIVSARERRVYKLELEIIREMISYY